MRQVAFLLCGFFLISTPGWAQGQGPETEPGAGPAFFFQRELPVPPPPDGSHGGVGAAIGIAGGDVNFVMAMPGSAKPVTGAPYRAEAVTETTQVLADGNRILNKVSVALVRDSLGRTRREESMGKIGPWHVNGPKMAFIHDPVSGADYILNISDSSATEMKRPEMSRDATWIGGPEPFRIALPAPGPQPEAVKTESLGSQVIEGVFVEGKRVTRTIAAGEIGNERPIEIVSETWFSPELQVLVSSKHVDPRFGETAYHLQGIDRSEPERSLFEVPENYKVRGGPPMPGFPGMGGQSGTIAFPPPQPVREGQGQ